MSDNQFESKPLPPLTAKMLKAHQLTLIGYWGLVILIPTWNLWWYPSQIFSNKVVTMFWLIPLVFPMLGLIRGKAYTHAWSGFIAVIYVCHGLGSLITSFNEILPIILEVLLSSLFLFGGMYFAKWRGEQLGLQLPKKK
ncbi:MAG: DUF2069 domain-containing protein [Kangiellaceae bacterium]|nr:DUF2069 domain-containing protein [Kangiellaceae bacterium]